MQPFPLEELVERIGSRYTLVVAAAKRARQLKDGAPPLIDLPTRNVLTIALHEIAAGLIEVVEPPPQVQAKVAAQAKQEIGELAAPEVVEAVLERPPVLTDEDLVPLDEDEEEEEDLLDEELFDEDHGLDLDWPNEE